MAGIRCRLSVTTAITLALLVLPVPALAQDAGHHVARGDSLRSAAEDAEGTGRAIAAYRRALSLDPAAPGALSGIGQAFLDAMIRKLYYEPYDRGGAAVAADSAEHYLRHALRASPDESALATLADVVYRRTDAFGLDPAGYDTAAVYAARLVPLDPSRGWLLLGQIYGRKGEHAFSIDALQRSVRADSASYPAALWLGYRHFDLGQHDQGIPWQIRASALDSSSTTARNLLGFSYIHIARPDLARRPFDESVALGTTGFSVGGHMMIRLAREDFEGAIAYTDSVRRAHPESAWAWARLGEAHLFAGHHDEAAHAFEEALARDSASTNIYTWKSTALPLAYLYQEQGRTAEAAPLIERSYAHADAMMRRGQEPWNAYYQFAALALMEGERTEAIRWLRTAHAAGMPGRVYVEYDPLLSGLRGDREFEEIVQRLRWRELEAQRRLGIGN